MQTTAGQWMAIALRRPLSGCIHHTDRGSEYCSHDYQKLLRQNGFKVSLSAIACNRLPAMHEQQGKLLRQCGRRDVLQDDQGGDDLVPILAHTPLGRGRDLWIHQRLLQSAP
ncbi:MAG: hypothetical protein ACJAVR_002542 [Paracoccaceae bacterium]|jgi:hypothetical protein